MTQPEVEINVLEELRDEMKGSFLRFIQTFYEIRNGRPFVMSKPAGRESHYITMSRELMKFFNLETKHLIINVPPGFGKSTFIVYFVAWCFTYYPDCQFLYVSYAKHLAEKHTSEIKAIMQLSHYIQLFGVRLAKDSKAKGHFRTEEGGSVMAFGSSGAITGQDSGLPNMDRFSGCTFIDDAHKPDEVTSDTMRQAVIDNYSQTIKTRARGNNVGTCFIGQRLHESDLAAYLIDNEDGNDWKRVVLKGIDDAGNALAPNLISLERLRIEQDKNPYVFSSQYQQDPQPAGGGIFKEEWFLKLDDTPNILATFLTCDTAETEKEYNDATVFSFWGVYRPIVHGRELDDVLALHWIDCIEVRVEPKDLENEFLDFWAACMRFYVKPKLAAIEKKSTGTTLVSILKDMQGLRILEVERTRASGSKTNRFLATQPYVANKLVTLPKFGKHTENCIKHMGKITANNTHRFDDIADTVSDAVKLGLIDKVILNAAGLKTDYTNLSQKLVSTSHKIHRLRQNAFR